MNDPLDPAGIEVRVTHADGTVRTGFAMQRGYVAEDLSVTLDFPDTGRRVSSLGRAGTVREDGSIEWDDPDDA